MPYLKLQGNPTDTVNHEWARRAAGLSENIYRTGPASAPHPYVNYGPHNS